MAVASTNKNFGGFGYAVSEDVTGATKTLDAADSGKVMNFTATCTVTLPSTAVGIFYNLRVGAADITLNVSPAALDGFAGVDSTAVDNKDLIFTSQPIGSYVKLFGNGVAGWNVVELHGVATDEA